MNLEFFVLIGVEGGDLGFHRLMLLLNFKH